MDTESFNENGQSKKDPEYFLETTESEKNDHNQLMQECERGDILLGIDTVISRQFFTELSSSEIRDTIKQDASLAKWLVTGVYHLSHIVILSSILLSFFVFDWWAPVAIVGLFLMWWISKSTAVVGYHPNGILRANISILRCIQKISRQKDFLFRLLVLAIGITIEIYLQRGWVFNIWMTLIFTIPLIEKILYSLSTIHLRMIIINNAMAWRLFNGRGAKIVSNPNKPLKTSDKTH